MNKNSAIILGIIIILAVGVFAFSGNKTKTKEVITTTPAFQNDTPVDEVTTTEQVDQQVLGMTTSGSYEAYSSEKVAMAEANDVVIFFHASWCPSCRGLNTDIEKNANKIPSGVTILKADYDKETELKKKYGVTTQHTLVQVDKDGNLIKKWSGGSELENLLSQIQ